MVSLIFLLSNHVCQIHRLCIISSSNRNMDIKNLCSKESLGSCLTIPDSWNNRILNGRHLKSHKVIRDWDNIRIHSWCTRSASSVAKQKTKQKLSQLSLWLFAIWLNAINGLARRFRVGVEPTTVEIMYDNVHRVENWTKCVSTRILHLKWRCWKI